MGTRSLFNPGGIGSYSSARGAGGIGSLFRPSLEINPELRNLLKYGAYDESLDSGIEPFVASGGLFGSGTRLANQANAEVLRSKILAKYASDLANRNALGQEAFRTNENIRQAAAIQELQNKEEERNLAEQGTAIGQDIGNLPSDLDENGLPIAKQTARIFPFGQTFTTPEEQARAYNAKFGAKTSIVQAPGEALKPFGGGGYYNPLSREAVEPAEFKPRQEISVVPTKTGRMTSVYNPQTQQVEQHEEIKEYPKSVTSYERIPGQSYNVSEPVTQEELNNYKPGTNVQAKPASPLLTNINPNSTLNESGYFSTDVGPGHPQRPPAANTGVAPSPPIAAKPSIDLTPPRVEGILPQLSAGLNQAFLQAPIELNKRFAAAAQELAPSKEEVSNIVKPATEGTVGALQGLNAVRQALVRGVNEKPQETTSSPLAYIEFLRRALNISGEKASEVLQGLMSLNPESFPYPTPNELRKRKIQSKYTVAGPRGVNRSLEYNPAQLINQLPVLAKPGY